ncbi:hypothetical protein BC567DRAFT_248573 [Phyllosticta citribraziliensis]
MPPIKQEEASEAEQEELAQIKQEVGELQAKIARLEEKKKKHDWKDSLVVTVPGNPNWIRIGLEGGDPTKPAWHHFEGHPRKYTNKIINHEGAKIPFRTILDNYVLDTGFADDDWKNGPTRFYMACQEMHNNLFPHSDFKRVDSERLEGVLDRWESYPAMVTDDDFEDLAAFLSLGIDKIVPVELLHEVDMECSVRGPGKRCHWETRAWISFIFDLELPKLDFSEAFRPGPPADRRLMKPRQDMPAPQPLPLPEDKPQETPLRKTPPASPPPRPRPDMAKLEEKRIAYHKKLLDALCATSGPPLPLPLPASAEMESRIPREIQIAQWEKLRRVAPLLFGNK